MYRMWDEQNNEEKCLNNDDWRLKTETDSNIYIDQKWIKFLCFEFWIVLKNGDNTDQRLFPLVELSTKISFSFCL